MHHVTIHDRGRKYEVAFGDSVFEFIARGHTVNVFLGKTNIDCFSVGDFSKGAAGPHEVTCGISEWMRVNVTEAPDRLF